jgi:organic hydroperoxide reductase OsmC/OhrA
MIKYPIEFKSVTESEFGVQSNWTVKSDNNITACSVPPEFMGPGGAISPEDFYNYALSNCFVATFKVYAENSKLTFKNVLVESKLIVDLDENKKPYMKDFYLKAIIFTPSNSEKAILLAEKASKSGFILNSVKTKCHFDIAVS